MKKSFKEFKVLFEESTDSAIEELAKFAVDNGFSDNLSAMIEHDQFLYRGSNTTNQMIEDSGKIYLLSKQRAKQRQSIYSGSRFLTNLWHGLDMPSRKTARFSTSNKSLAQDFGDVVVIVPRDGTKMTFSKTDFNTGYSKELEDYFGVPLKSGFSLGDFSELFDEMVSQLTNIGENMNQGTLANKVFEKFLDMKRDNVGPQDVKDLFSALDALLSKIDFDSDAFKKELANRSYHYNADRIKSIQKMKANMPSSKHFKDFIDAVYAQMLTSENMNEILGAIKKEPEDNEFASPEIWWEGDSLVILPLISKPIYKKMLVKALDAARFMHHMNK